MRTLRTYLLGFGLSLVLTLVAFGLVGEHLATDHVFPSHQFALPLLVVLALAQFLVQLILFLGVGHESKPRWNLAAFSLALIIVFVLVGGTLWIMHNLSHGQMVPTEPFEKEIVSPQTEE